MNQWLEKFWTSRSPFRIAAVRDREILSGSFLDKILGGLRNIGNTVTSRDIFGIRSKGSKKNPSEDLADVLFFLAGVYVEVDLVPALSMLLGTRVRGTFGKYRIVSKAMIW